MEVSGYGGKKVAWEVVKDHVVGDQNENVDISLQGFIFFMNKMEGGGGSNKFPYFLVLIGPWPGYW